MPTFQVQLTHADSGMNRRTLIDAPDSASALRSASGDGWLASEAIALHTSPRSLPPATSHPPTQPTIEPTVQTICDQLSTLINRVEKVERSGIIRRPMITITNGILLATVVLMFLAFSFVWLAGGYAEFKKWRQYWGDVPINYEKARR